MRRTALSLLVLVLALAGSSAQPLFTDAFPPEEFAARRVRVMQAIGDGVAVLQGAAEAPAYVKFRQSNHFFYLSGVEVPRALLVIDGRARKSTLYLPPRNERLERSEGPLLVPGTDAARLTGIDVVAPRDRFGDALASLAVPRRRLYTPFRREAQGASTPHHAAAFSAATAADPWDARPSREDIFIKRLKDRVPQMAIENLDPVLDGLRLVKSGREIAVVREATRQAGLAIMEAMRSARPGLFEYELEAIGDFFFKKHNAQGIGYFALVAAGANAYFPHYHAAQSRLADGDLVLYDYAPDFKYYTADVTRQFPANGRFSARQKEVYSIYLRLYRALMTSIRVNAAQKNIIQDAARKMDGVLAEFPFKQPGVREAAEQMVAGFRKDDRLGHWVGMEVHDVDAPSDTLRPGMIFSIEPALTIADERLYVRLEDMILITESGYENLSAFVPSDVEAIERLMEEEGMLDRVRGGTGTTREEATRPAGLR